MPSRYDTLKILSFLGPIYFPLRSKFGLRIQHNLHLCRFKKDVITGDGPLVPYPHLPPPSLFDLSACVAWESSFLFVEFFTFCPSLPPPPLEGTAPLLPATAVAPAAPLFSAAATFAFLIFSSSQLQPGSSCDILMAVDWLPSSRDLGDGPVASSGSQKE